MSRAIDAYRAAMTEADMRQAIFDVVDLSGGARSWIRDSRRLDVVGLPDLLIALPPTFYGLELKTMVGHPRLEQQRWLELMGRCDRFVGGMVRPMRTLDAFSLDEVLAMLRGER